VQTLNAFFAPPFAAAFLLGLFWRRASSQGALAAIIGGFLVAVALKAVGYAFVMPGWFYPFGNQAGIIWSLAVLFGIIASLITPAPAKGMTIYDFASVLREGLGTRWYNSVILWWAGSFVLMIGVMLIFTDLVFPV
jgi:solute:Na+ symporter, SSS family